MKSELAFALAPPQMANSKALDAILAAPLRGEVATWPDEWSGNEVLEAAQRRVSYHGIGGLLHARCELLKGWPEPLLTAIRGECLGRTMWEMRHKLLLGEVIEGLFTAGIRSVLLKGTALAYQHYGNPAERFRGDSDLLVAPCQLSDARTVMRELGWQRAGTTHGPFGDLHYQEIWQYEDAAGLVHDIDLHWQVTNSMALMAVLNDEIVLRDSVPLPRLSPHARCADTITALIHRAVNRAEHARSGYFSLDRNEFDPDRLIWAKDIDVLTKALSTEQYEDLVRRSIAAGVAAIVLDALDFASRTLASRVSATVRTQLSAAPLSSRAARYLTTLSDSGRLLEDFRATPGFISRLSYVLARAFPAPSHLRATFPGTKLWPLPFLYLRRLFRITIRLLKGPGP